MRLLLISAAALGLLLAVPAQASAQEAAQCPIMIAPAAFARELADAMSIREMTEEEQESIGRKVKALADACRNVHNIPDEREEDYLNLAMTGIVMARLAVDLEEVGIPPSFVEEALDVGEGRTNLQGEEFSDESAVKLLERLEKDGFKLDSVDEAIWVKAGAYAAATGAYYTLAGSFN